MFEKHIEAAKRVAERASQSDFVEAVAVAGSVRNGLGTESSDVDTYVYITRDISMSEREQITGAGSISRETIDYWGASDNFYDSATDIEVECMYFRTDFMESEVVNPLEKYQAKMGFSTAFWHTVKNSLILYDAHSWLAELQKKSNEPYPDALVKNIVAVNFPLLRDIRTSYKQQISAAMKRNDLIIVYTKVTALLQSYFDIIFAVNKIPHSGEKRMIEFALQCEKQASHMQADLTAILQDKSSDALIQNIDGLVDHLEELLESEGLL